MQQKTQHKRKKETVAVNSRLIRRPIQRCFAIFLLPTFAAFCIGFLWPFVKGLYLSFCTFTTTSNAKWVGLQNYQKALTDASFLHAFWYTALVAIVSLILINVLSFAVAYALTRKIPGANIYRGVFFMPNLIGGIVLGYIWQTHLQRHPALQRLSCSIRHLWLLGLDCADVLAAGGLYDDYLYRRPAIGIRGYAGSRASSTARTAGRSCGRSPFPPSCPPSPSAPS